jgi:hypothetical protein
MPIRPKVSCVSVMVLAVGLVVSGCSSSGAVDRNINTDVAAGWVPPDAGTKLDTVPDLPIGGDGPDAVLDSTDLADATSDDGAGIDGVTPEGG